MKILTLVVGHIEDNQIYETHSFINLQKVKLFLSQNYSWITPEDITRLLRYDAIAVDGTDTRLQLLTSTLK